MNVPMMSWKGAIQYPWKALGEGHKCLSYVS